MPIPSLSNSTDFICPVAHVYSEGHRKIKYHKYEGKVWPYLSEGEFSHGCLLVDFFSVIFGQWWYEGKNPKWNQVENHFDFTFSLLKN